MSIKELLNKQYLNLGKKGKQRVPRSPTGNYMRSSLISLNEDELSHDIEPEEEEPIDNSLDDDLEVMASPKKSGNALRKQRTSMAI